MLGTFVGRRVVSVCVLALVLPFAINSASGQSRIHDAGVLYMMPVWPEFVTGTDAEVATEVARLRNHFTDGGPVRLGFTVYMFVDMERWDVSTEAEATANLSLSIARLDQAIARARAHNLPIAISVMTYIRSTMDVAQQVSQAEDRRVMQWFDDNSLAEGWWTLSSYARRQTAVRELYLRAFARIVANRMVRFPDTLVAASGDGEIELAYQNTGSTYADYSPFAIAEFRDWLRGEGLYGVGQRYAGQAYTNAGRYRGDASPALDTNGDGHTLNGDFNLTLTSWDLRYFDWQLSDPSIGDPKAIPESEFRAAGFNPFPDAGVGLFDPPRTLTHPFSGWQQVWFEFRLFMVNRYTRDYAEWLTTSADPITGRTIPSERWSSYQIPGDYLFGHSPENPDVRYLTSASSWVTADIRPFGGAGITSFNTRSGDTYGRTLQQVAPLLAGLNVRWSIFEWNPSVPSTDDPAIYREDLALVEQWRPFVVSPFLWQNTGEYRVLGTGFEVALTETIGRLRNAPWSLNATVTGNGVRLTWAPPVDGAAPDSYVLEAGSSRGAANIVTLDTGSTSTILEAVAPFGTYYVRIRARRSGVLSSPSNEAVLTVAPTPALGPAPPISLTAQTGANGVVFNWFTPVGGTPPTGYVIEAGSASGLANLARIRLDNTLTFAAYGVPAGSYFIRVRGDSAAGEGSASREVVITIPGTGPQPCAPVDPPPQPVFTLAGRNVTFEWRAPTGPPPSGYTLEAGTASGLANLVTVPVGATTRFSATAPPGTYYVRLRSNGLCGTSAPGPEIRLVVR